MEQIHVVRDLVSESDPILGLIDPYRRQVLVLRPGREIEVVSGDCIASEGPVDGLFLIWPGLAVIRGIKYPVKLRPC